MTDEAISGAAEEDWISDSSGQEHMDKLLYKDAIFSLADVWCETIEAEEYRDYLREMYGLVFPDSKADLSEARLKAMANDPDGFADGFVDGVDGLRGSDAAGHGNGSGGRGHGHGDHGHGAGGAGRHLPGGAAHQPVDVAPQIPVRDHAEQPAIARASALRRQSDAGAPVVSSAYSDTHRLPDPTSSRGPSGLRVASEPRGRESSAGGAHDGAQLYSSAGAPAGDMASVITR